MALRNRSEDSKRMSDDYLSSTISSSTLEIVLDDRSVSDSGDEDSNDQARYNLTKLFKNFFILFILIKDNQQPVLLVMIIHHIEETNNYHYEFVRIKFK